MLVTRRFGRSALGLAAALFLAPCNGLAQSAPGPSLAEMVETCGACHGPDGNSQMPVIPSLAGQPQIFTETQLIFFREGLRKSEQMSPLAKNLTDEEIEALAAHYAALAPKSQAGPPDDRLLDRGRALARALRCGTCHLPDFRGRQQMPRLAAQREDYLALAMTAYRDQTRGGADTTMTDIVRGLTNQDIAALAHFLARQEAPPAQ